MRIAPWAGLLVLAFPRSADPDASGPSPEREVLRLRRASPDVLVRLFQPLFRSYGLRLERGREEDTVALSAPAASRRVAYGRWLLDAMDLSDRSLQILHDRTERFEFARTYTLRELLDRIERFSGDEANLERFRRMMRRSALPPGMHGCGGPAWKDWRILFR